MQEVVSFSDSVGNWKKLRTAMEEAVPPGVPHLGLFLRDLLWIDEGNPETLGKGIINFAKRRMVGTIIQRLRTFQQRNYGFGVNESIRQWLENVEAMEHDSLFDLSKKIEPTTGTQPPPTQSPQLPEKQ